MVKIAAVGGTGNVAGELLRAPIRSGHHDITIFTRSAPPTTQTPGVSYQQIDYHDLPGLTRALEGFDTCLSFLVAHLDEDNICQKNLIQACIDAKVRRFAPSEWSIASNSGVPSYANKDIIAAYLHEKRAKNELGNLQYCLFQPGVFVDYWAHPYVLSPGLHSWPFFIDYENRRAIVLDDGDQPMMQMPVSDVSEFLERALSDDRPWPTVGGMQGPKATSNEILALGKKIRGGEWTVEHVKSEDIEKRELKTSWVPYLTHPVIPVDQREAFSREFVFEFFKALKMGAWVVGDEWNKRFPDFKPIGFEEYLTKAWEGKPYSV